MRRYKFIVGGKDEGIRLDQYLVNRLSKSLSRTYIQKLIADGKVVIDGKPVKSHHKLRYGEQIYAEVIFKEKIWVLPSPIILDIIYEDKFLLVVNKPAGMVTHPAPKNYKDTLVNVLLYHTNNLSNVNGELKPGIVHRLDKETSGLLVVAKTDTIHRNLANQFKNRQVVRKYIGIVKDGVEFDEGKIDKPIGRLTSDRTKLGISFIKSKHAVTYYKVLKRKNEYSVLEIIPETGRTHQIRVHLYSIGHPILGDIKYGSKSELINRQALHASNLGFLHPHTKKFIEFGSTLPEDMKKLV